MKVLMACGGSGGHIFPAFSVAEELKAKNPKIEILYACGRKDIESAIFKIVQNEKVIRLDALPLGRKGVLYHLLFLIKLCKGFIQSFKLVKHEKPDVVVGFGGYLSFPVVMAGKLAGCKTIVHEQNVIPGIANKILSKWVDGVALSYEESQGYLVKDSKICLTGNPIRSSIERDCRQEALDFFKFDARKTTLLVLGGSQGAESVNTLFLNALMHLSRDLKSRLQVIHLCGRMPLEQAEVFFKDNQVEARVFSFFDRMDMAYGCADFAIGRAGATFLAEISAKNIPSILIPYPYANGHQLLNAEAFSKTHSCWVLEQKYLDAKRLAEVLEKNLPAAKPSSSYKASSALNSRAKFANFILEKAHA